MLDILKKVQIARSLGNEVWASRPASRPSIKALEDAVGFTLPPSYKKFLMEFGGMSICNSHISGIIDDDPLLMEGGGLYSDTMFLRQDFEHEYEIPRYLWVLERHEDGGYCFNRDIPLENGEFAIVNYEPHLPHESYTEILARSFDEFMDEWFFPPYVESSL